MKNNIKKTLQLNKMYLNISYNILNTYLTKSQMALTALVYALNNTKLTATNKEIANFLGTTANGTNIKSMIDNINSKTNGLIEVRYNTKVNHLGKIKTDGKNDYRVVRSLHLTRPLHIKGERYVNVPASVFSNKDYFLSSNELRVLGHAKSMNEGTFKGFLRVFANGSKLSLGIVKRALKRLVILKALRKKWISVFHNVKNVYYSVNIIRVNSNWSPPRVNIQTSVVKQRIRKGSTSEDEEWNSILSTIGNL